MRLNLSLIAAVSALFLSGVAQAQTPAGSTAVCKDGTYSSAASKRGACSGHKGIGQWLATDKAAPTKAPAPPSVTNSPAPTPAAAPARQSPAAAVTGKGGTGQVWVNTKSKVYHCQGDRYYGNTKAGSYMSESSAVAAGNRPDHGKACH